MNLRDFPSVDKLSREKGYEQYPFSIRVKAIKQAIAQVRHTYLKTGTLCFKKLDQTIHELALKYSESPLRTAINLTGTLIHTGLGRAPLPSVALEAIATLSEKYVTLESDYLTGKRGDRQSAVRELLCNLTYAEDAFVVNNCAAATLLTLSALCEDREVLLSHGEMVEIGGGFRMPDVVKQSGCTLIGVGCTNKTKLEDYSSAINTHTAAILRCSPSNFKMIGFTERAQLDHLKQLCIKNNLILIEDMGSGCILDTTQYGLPPEETLQKIIENGADIVLASGDKLLGSLQCGLILGKKELIQKIKSHPLARAVRIDKLTLVGLEATLKLYREGQIEKIPIWNFLSTPLEEIKNKAEQLLQAYPGPGEIKKGITLVGGGSLPEEGIETWCTILDSNDPNSLLQFLRYQNPSIWGRIHKDKVVLDPRCAYQKDILLVCDALIKYKKQVIDIM